MRVAAAVQSKLDGTDTRPEDEYASMIAKAGLSVPEGAQESDSESKIPRKEQVNKLTSG